MTEESALHWQCRHPAPCEAGVSVKLRNTALHGWGRLILKYLHGLLVCLTGHTALARAACTYHVCDHTPFSLLTDRQLPEFMINP
jgi:hypothetical protein